MGEWDHFTRRTETFQKISNMYGYFLYILHCMDFSVNFRWWGEGGMVTAPGPSCGPSARGVNPPVCCVLAVTYVRGSFCWLLAPGLQFLSGGGADILAPGLHMSTLNCVRCEKIHISPCKAVSKFLTQHSQPSIWFEKHTHTYTHARTHAHAYVYPTWICSNLNCKSFRTLSEKWGLCVMFFLGICLWAKFPVYWQVGHC